MSNIKVQINCKCPKTDLELIHLESRNLKFGFHLAFGI
jgi:hypothetical protein